MCFFWTLPVLLQRWFSTWCEYTYWYRGKTEKGQSPEYFKIFRKNTIFNEHPVLECLLLFFAKFSAYCRTPRICRPCEFTFENLWARSPLTLSACATCPLTLKVWEGRELEAPLNPPDQCRKTLRFGANESCTSHSVCRWVLLFTFLSLSRFTSVPAPFSLLCLLHNNKSPLKGEVRLFSSRVMEIRLDMGRTQKARSNDAKRAHKENRNDLCRLC